MRAIPLLSDRRKKCDIYFRANGRIDISSHIAKALGLCRGDMLNLTMVEGELYLYVSHKALDTDTRQRPNAVHPSKGNFHHYRCQYKEMVQCVSQYTKSDESWLYAGRLKDLSSYGIPNIGITLIYKNNRYNGNKNN